MSVTCNEKIELLRALVFGERAISEERAEYLNLLTTSEDDLCVAFDLVEYEGFYDYSSSIPRENNVSFPLSLAHAKKALLEFREDVKAMISGEGDYADWPQWELEEAIEDLKLGGNLCLSIYGNGGWHRYYVGRDGVLSFSEGHASKGDPKIQDAQDLGFRIH
tara:strand:+ start:70 stop:558 length:489 start_codon:yes stop_codon:yes gene_type:complete